MKIELCYKDPYAGYKAYNSIIGKEHLNMKRFSTEFMDEQEKYIKNLVSFYGNLVEGSEDLHISIDTDDKEIIDVNGSKYRLIK